MLRKTDCAILRYIHKCGKTNCNDIFSRFRKKDEAKLRFKELFREGMIFEDAEGYTGPDGESTWRGLGIYYLSDAGKIALSNHKLSEIRERRDSLRFWIPVAISVFATIGAWRKELTSLLQSVMMLWK